MARVRTDRSRDAAADRQGRAAVGGGEPTRSGVDDRVADLLAPPADLVGSFDLVVEVCTVQAMPRDLRRATLSVLVAEGAQAEGSSTVRLRVRLGSIGMPGPIVVLIVIFWT